MNVIGLGSAGCGIADKFAQYPQYSIYKVDVGVNSDFDFTHPAAKSMLGTRSKYNYNPRQQFYLDNEMIGDTINVFIETVFNSDVGNREVIEDKLKIIIQ